MERTCLECGVILERKIRKVKGKTVKEQNEQFNRRLFCNHSHALTYHNREQRINVWRHNETELRCVGCKRWLTADLNNYYKNKTAYKNLSHECKNCIQERRLFKRTEGTWTIENKKEQYKRQNKRCWICGIILTFDDACADHNHKALIPRGILCYLCNLKIYTLEEEGWLINAFAYLMHFQPAGTKPIPVILNSLINQVLSVDFVKTYPSVDNPIVTC